MNGNKVEDLTYLTFANHMRIQQASANFVQKLCLQEITLAGALFLSLQDTKNLNTLKKSFISIFFE